MKNKKLTTLSVALGLSIITLISGISAYFTDADTTTNEFTIGKISLDLEEPNWIPPKNITPNQVIQKDPQIKNDGINDEFVFLKVKVPVKNIITAELDGTKLPVTETELFTYTINENWTQIGKEIKTTGFVTRIYAYAKDNQCIALKKGETTNPLFDTVKFCNATEEQGLELTKEQIVINAYGIQTKDINDGPDGKGDKTAPMDVWEVINNQRNVGLEIEKEIKIMKGYDFNKKFEENFNSATSIEFVKNRTIPENVRTIDFSENQDNSILGWLEGNTCYVSSKGKIMANEDCSRMFYDISNLREIQFQNFDTSKVTNMENMFFYSQKLEKLDVSSFNTSKVINMNSMFHYCPILKELDVSNFNTSNVINMGRMFESCHDLRKLNVSNFDTSNVTDMNGMFAHCWDLTELNVSSFDTSNVTDMSHMFIQCENLKTLKVSATNWVINKDTDIQYMWHNCPIQAPTHRI